jgi:biotin transport system substrate-specific component
MTSAISIGEMRSLVRHAVWASLIALGAWAALPLAVVPITLQTFFLFLAAFVEGPRAYLAGVLYLLAGLIGLPVFTGGQTGPALIFGPTAGYALSFPLVMAIAGLGKGKGKPSTRKMACFGVLALLTLYLCGSTGLVLNLGLSFLAALAVNITFVLGDTLKIVGAVIVSLGILSRQRLRQPIKELKPSEDL